MKTFAEKVERDLSMIGASCFLSQSNFFQQRFSNMKTPNKSNHAFINMKTEFHYRRTIISLRQTFPCHSTTMGTVRRWRNLLNWLEKIGRHHSSVRTFSSWMKVLQLLHSFQSFCLLKCLFTASNCYNSTMMLADRKIR